MIGDFNYQQPYIQHPCPACGYCPCCGRRNPIPWQGPTWPYQPWGPFNPIIVNTPPDTSLHDYQSVNVSCTS